MKSISFPLLSAVAFLLLCVTSLHATPQDTVRISLPQFIERGLDRSGQMRYEHGAVDLAENRVGEARASRILPSVNLNTNHGLIPGVYSDRDTLSPNEYYLDPDLRNDWNDWAIFTRAEINAIQPIFAWGAINKAIRAAEMGARAAQHEFEAKQQGFELQLYELYYSYLLALEIERILKEAEETLEQVEDQIETMREEGDPNLRERDVFQFEMFQSEFEVQKTQVYQSLQRVQRIWDYILGSQEGGHYLPAEDFLDPVQVELQPYDYYLNLAMENRPEMQGVEAGINAYRSSIEAIKAQNLPTLYLGLSASYAHTPNRPRQSNPFIINNTNYMSAAFGFGIRQNLNFQAVRNRIDRERIEYNRVRDLRDALSDGILLELSEEYMEAAVARSRVTQTEESLVIARNWVRHEQLNYDYGFGNAEDLLDAIRNELELRVTLRQNIFDLNRQIATLYNSAGLPVSQLATQ